MGAAGWQRSLVIIARMPAIWSGSISIPRLANEQSGNRPAIVLPPRQYNMRSISAIVISTKLASFRDSPPTSLSSAAAPIGLRD
jgi:mRNA-degrading endonuclease toxin of MazEF toxin-antitoxin module